MIVRLIPFNSVILYVWHIVLSPVLLATDISTSCITFSLDQDAAISCAVK